MLRTLGEPLDDAEMPEMTQTSLSVLIGRPNVIRSPVWGPGTRPDQTMSVAERCRRGADLSDAELIGRARGGRPRGPAGRDSPPPGPQPRRGPSRLCIQCDSEYCTLGTVKTITITITEELDRRAAAEARRRGISKSELIREGLGAVLAPPTADDEEDLWRSLAGFGAEGRSAAEGEIDETVYRR